MKRSAISATLAAKPSAFASIFVQARRQVQRAVVRSLQPAQELHPVPRELVQVERAPSPLAGDVRVAAEARFGRRGVVIGLTEEAGLLQPPEDILAPVAAGHPARAADAEVDLTSRSGTAPRRSGSRTVPCRRRGRRRAAALPGCGTPRNEAERCLPARPEGAMGCFGCWNIPVAITTWSASIGPAPVSTRNPLPAGLGAIAVTSVLKRTGAA